jgi:hypothetical protein
MRFGHELAKYEFSVVKLPCASSLVIPWRPHYFFEYQPKILFLLCFSSFDNSELLCTCATLEEKQTRRRQRRRYTCQRKSHRASRDHLRWPMPPNIRSATWAPPCAARGSRQRTRCNPCGHASSTTLVLVRRRPRQLWRRRGAGDRSSRCSPCAT